MEATRQGVVMLGGMLAVASAIGVGCGIEKHAYRGDICFMAIVGVGCTVLAIVALVKK